MGINMLIEGGYIREIAASDLRIGDNTATPKADLALK
jgi:hypothetical protein